MEQRLNTRLKWLNKSGQIFLKSSWIKIYYSSSDFSKHDLRLKNPSLKRRAITIKYIRRILAFNCFIISFSWTQWSYHKSKNFGQYFAFNLACLVCLVIYRNCISESKKKCHLMPKILRFASTVSYSSCCELAVRFYWSELLPFTRARSYARALLTKCRTVP